MGKYFTMFLMHLLDFAIVSIVLILVVDFFPGVCARKNR